MFQSYVQVLLVICFISLVIYQQFQIVTLQAEVGTFATTSNMTMLSDRVKEALRTTDQFKQDLSIAQKNLTADVINLRIFDNDTTAFTILTTLKTDIKGDRHSITENRAYIDSFMNMIAGIFVVFTIIVAFYHIKLHGKSIMSYIYIYIYIHVHT